MHTVQIITNIVIWAVVVMNLYLSLVSVRRLRKNRKETEKLQSQLKEDYIKMAQDLQKAYLAAIEDLDKTVVAIMSHPEMQEWRDRLKKLSDNLYAVKVKIAIHEVEYPLSAIVTKSDEKKISKLN